MTRLLFGKYVYLGGAGGKTSPFLCQLRDTALEEVKVQSNVAELPLATMMLAGGEVNTGEGGEGLSRIF